MSRKQPFKTSWANVVWDFVEANPKLAATIAFQLGNMAGEAVSTPNEAARSLIKNARKVSRQVAVTIPRSLSVTAIKYLPGPLRKLPSRKRHVGKIRKAQVAH
jgi:hypothetical protein